MDKLWGTTNINLTVIHEKRLAMALCCKRHRLIGEIINHGTGSIEWLFIPSERLNKNIEKFWEGRLLVDAQLYEAYLSDDF